MKSCLSIGSLFLLAGAFHSTPSACPKYDRIPQYGRWKSWGDCQDTRAKVLIRDSKVQVLFRGIETCDVDSGLWYDPYSDESFNAASQVEIEHVIPLSEAHKSGSWAWPLEKRKAFTNFLDSSYHLLPIKGSVNSSKGDRDPAKWMPPNKDYWHQYALNWVKIKNRWDLTANSDELDTLHSLLKEEVGVVFPREAPEDICTDTGTVSIQFWVSSKMEHRMLGTAYPMDILGRLQIDNGKLLGQSNKISLSRQNRQKAKN